MISITRRVPRLCLASSSRIIVLKMTKKCKIRKTSCFMVRFQ